MSDVRGPHIDLPERVHEFVVACTTDDLTDDLRTAFEQLLRESDDACRLYLKCVDISVALPSILSAIPDEESPYDISFLKRPPNTPPSAPAAPGGLWHGMAGYLSGWPVAYLIATVIFAIGGVIGAVTHVSQPGQVATHSASSPQPPAPSPSFVGRITGMADCQWANPQTAPATSTVRLGHKYALVAGLLEITYETGAKVILQGPVSFEVESTNGGFLSVGKLTGKVEVETAKGFAVRTPTAVVTDLGTEFGVEVWPDRHQEVVVFQGQVRVATGDGQAPAGQAKILQAGHTGTIHAKASTVTIGVTPIATMNRFTRTVPATTASLLSDTVSGDGLVLWLKADAIKGISDGSPVSAWYDGSRTRNHMYRVSAESPTYVAGDGAAPNNMPAVRFNGRQELAGALDADPHTPGVQTLTTPFTLITVARNSDRGDAVARAYFGGGRACMAFGLTRRPDDGGGSFAAWAPGVASTLRRTAPIDANWNVHAYTLGSMSPQSWTWSCNGTITHGAASNPTQPGTLYFWDTFENANAALSYSDSGLWGLNKELAARQSGTMTPMTYESYAPAPPRITVNGENSPGALHMTSVTDGDGQGVWASPMATFPTDATVSATLTPNFRNQGAPTDWIALGMRGNFATQGAKQNLADGSAVGAFIKISQDGRWEFRENDGLASQYMTSGKVPAAASYVVTMTAVGDQITASINGQPIDLNGEDSGMTRIVTTPEVLYHNENYVFVNAYGSSAGYAKAALVDNLRVIAGPTSGMPQQYQERVNVGSSGNGKDYWTGDVAEILVYKRVLTPSELNRIGGYLATKYHVKTTWESHKSVKAK